MLGSLSKLLRLDILLPVGLGVAFMLLGAYAQNLKQETLRLNAQISKMERDAAVGTADTLREAGRLLQDAKTLQDAQTDQILTGLAKVDAGVRSGVSSLVQLMKDTTNDPTYDCRRLPLPRGYLDGLQRETR
jgi:predicted Ser/Thr protein kinase